MPLCLSQNILPFERFYTHTQRESVGQSHQHRVVPSLSLSPTTTTRNRNTRQTDRKTNGLTDQVCPKTHQPLRFIDYHHHHFYSPRFVLPPSATITQFLNLFRHSVHGSSRVCRRRRRTHSLSAVVFCICNYPNLHSYQHQTFSFFFFFFFSVPVSAIVRHCSVPQFCSIIITVTVEAAAAKERENDSSLARRH